MRRVEPQVFLIAYTQIDDAAIREWLMHVGGLRVLDHIAGDDGEKLVELSGRNCYRSFDIGLNPNISTIRRDSEEYHRNILKSGHGSVLEHATCTFAFEDISRVFSHETVRHRVGTAFCLSGDALIYSERFNNNRRNGVTKRTLKQLYEMTLTPYGRSRIPLLKLRCYDLHSGTFTTTKVKSIIDSGKKPCYKVVLQDGKSVICTAQHRFLTADRQWKTLDEIVGGLSLSVNGIATYNHLGCIAVNGEKLYKQKDWFIQNYLLHSSKEMASICGLSKTHMFYWAKRHGVKKRELWDSSLATSTCYTDSDWLEQEYRVKRRSIKELALECNTTQSVIRNNLRKYHLQSNRMPKSFTPWNKNKRYKNKNAVWTKEMREKASQQKLGEKNPQWKGGTTKRSVKIRKQINKIRYTIFKRDQFCCRMCHSNKKICIHHIVPVWADPENTARLNAVDNLITLCRACHLKLNGKELKFVKYFQDLLGAKVAIGPVKKQPRGDATFRAKFVDMKHIEYVGVIPTYDIEVENSNHNFIANGIITHNSQCSLRYIRLEDISVWIPDIIANNPAALAVFEETIEKCEWAQKELAKIFDIANIKDFHTKKQLTSAFRRVAPIGLATGIVVTFNVRSLRWIIQMRTHESAEIEIRKVFNQVYEIAKEKYPILFQDFVKTDTQDGLFECKPDYVKV